MLVLPAAPPVALRGGGGVCTARRRRLHGAQELLSPELRHLPELLVRPPSACSAVCPPAARSVLWPGLSRPGLLRGRMRGAEPGRTGQGTRGARRCAGP